MNKRQYPAEWKIQKATWLAWPHNTKEWGKERLPRIRQFYVDLISTILDFQNVNLLLADESLLQEVANLTPEKNYAFKYKKIVIPNDNIWIRDYGPFFLEVAEETLKKSLLLDFEFNSWGRKFPPWDLNNTVPKLISLYLGQEIESYPIVLEGGSLEFSGDGLILTTEQCLLNKNRNPNLNKNDIESILKSAFNIEEVLWLKYGLEGDHTDGHIDNVARFVNDKKILICKSSDKKDANYEHLNESIKYLKSWKHPKKNYNLEIIELPMPNRMEIKNERLPNSYANFIFVNGGIIVPTFNCDNDKIAIEIFRQVFPDRKIVSIDASLLVEEGGGIHCMTKQETFI